MSPASINAALKRMGYDTQIDITAHDFRAMARTILHERLNIDPNIIEYQLARKVPDTLGAAYLDELKAGAKVLPFKQA
jgi:integrase